MPGVHTQGENNPVKPSVTDKSSSKSPLLTLGESRHMVPGRSTGRNPQRWPLIPFPPSVHRGRAFRPGQMYVSPLLTPHPCHMIKHPPIHMEIWKDIHTCPQACDSRPEIL